jgi:hypothetical protein
MTRHRDWLDLHWLRDTIPSRTRLATILSRERLKDTSLDYAGDGEREHAARHKAAEAMRERVRRRAADFTACERTRTGRLDNAWCLLPAGATALQVARLAFDAAERLRLFRHRQGVLRQWAEQVVPTLPPVSPGVDRSAAGEHRAALQAHGIETLRLWENLKARHDQERHVEATARQGLLRDAAASWRALAIRHEAAAFLAKWAGYLTQAWQTARPGISNDNLPGRTPPRMGPRPL